MVCTELMDDPVQMQAYAVLAGQVDGFLEYRGLHSWAALDVETFLAQSARTPSEAATQCCMLATVLPWMVRSGDLCSAEASQKCVELLGVCPPDIQARTCIVRTMQRVCELEKSAAGLPH